MLLQMIIKDLKRILRDKKALLITILMPLILISILGFSVGKSMGGELNLTTANVGVVILDDIEEDKAEMESFLSSAIMNNNMTDKDKQKMIDSLDELDFGKIFIEDVLANEKISEFVSYKVMDQKSAEGALADGDLTAVIIIPEKFSYNIWVNMFFPLKNFAEIEIISNPDQEIKAEIVKSITKSYTDRLSAGIIGKNTFFEAAIELNAGAYVYENIDIFMEELLASEYEEIKINYETIEGKKQISGFQYYAAAMGVMFMLFSSTFGAQYSLEEKQFHTYERLKISGAKLSTMMASRFVAMTIFTFIQLAIVILSSLLIFGVDWGAWFGVVIITLFSSFAIGSLSVLLSVINLANNSERVANFFMVMVVPILSIVGGSFVPNSSMPELVQKLGDMTPNGAALKGYLKIMQGYSVFELQQIILSLIIFSLVMLVSTYGIAKVREV